MNLQKKSGFTLIELLVVITIIGILATGGVAVFTTQLQGARDSKRIGDLKLMESAVNQYFADVNEFPSTGSTFSGEVKPYLSKTLTDPKAGKTVCWDSGVTAQDAACNGFYGTSEDASGLEKGRYKLAFHFEKKSNQNQGAADEGTQSGWLESFGGTSGNTTPVHTTAIY